MSYSEDYKERIEYMFAAFCKVVLRNAAFTAYRDFGRKQKREVYFEKYDKPTVFVVQGQEVIAASERLADALCRLPEQRRVALLMYFFLGYTDEKIGNIYGRNRSTICNTFSKHFDQQKIKNLNQ